MSRTENRIRKVETIQDEIDRLTQELKVALERQAEKDEFILKAADAKITESPAGKLAIACHDLLCHHNHTDGCGWYYEIDKDHHKWKAGNTHGQYLTIARKLMQYHDVSEATKLVMNLKKFRYET